MLGFCGKCLNFDKLTLYNNETLCQDCLEKTVCKTCSMLSENGYCELGLKPDKNGCEEFHES